MTNIDGPNLIRRQFEEWNTDELLRLYYRQRKVSENLRKEARRAETVNTENLFRSGQTLIPIAGIDLALNACN